MKRLTYIAVLAIAVGVFSTCEKFETLTKIETGAATPQATAINVSARIIELSRDGNTDHGICYATQNNPTISNGKLSLGKPKIGQFTGNVEGLNTNTLYYVRAYCQSGEGVLYGKTIPITTLSGESSLTTTTVNSITATTATSGGNITSDGGAAITARGVVWSTSQNPTTSSNQGITSNGTGAGSFISNITDLQLGTVYYVRAYATNSVGTFYGNQQIFKTKGLPVLTTTAFTSITTIEASCGGNITSDGGATITARGIVWSTSQSPTVSNNQGITSNGVGTGIFASNLTGLTSNTTYYVRAYAANSTGMSYGNELVLETLNIGEVYNPTTGKIWMDRNLGASRVATSSTDADAYGDLYQWGRGSDGHEKRSSGTTSTLSSNDNPGHGNFIIAPYGPFDWRNPQNSGLWQGVNSTNNPCTAGYRLPTDAEWNAERSSWSSNNNVGAFASPLKLSMAGYRDRIDGSLENVGTSGFYWSSTVDGTSSRGLGFNSSSASTGGSAHRAFGGAVRCIKD